MSCTTGSLSTCSVGSVLPYPEEEIHESCKTECFDTTEQLYRHLIRSHTDYLIKVLNKKDKKELTKPLITRKFLEPAQKWFHLVLEDPQKGLWMISQSIFRKMIRDNWKPAGEMVPNHYMLHLKAIELTKFHNMMPE